MGDDEATDLLILCVLVFGLACSFAASLKYGIFCILNGNLVEGILATFGATSTVAFIFWLYLESKKYA